MVSLISTAVNLFVFALITIGSGDARAPAKILEGSDADPKNVPYIVSLRRWGNHVCGGSFITTRFVLTAAHCFVGRADPPYTEGLVVVGDAARNRRAGRIHRVEKVTPHSEYERGTEKRWRNDIALIKLKEDIIVSPFEKPIDLPERDTPSYVIGLLSGWGQTTFRGEETDRLQSRTVNILPNEKCNEMGSDILSTNLCGFDGRKTGMCEGDSGGPLVYNNAIVGIVSFGVGCGLGYPDTYTRVYKYIEWINKTMCL